MKTYTLSFAQSLEHKHEHPERTAYKNGSGMNFDKTFKVWTSRAAMVTTIRMQQKRSSYSTDWIPLVKLSLYE
jgi:hypothetical protein